MLDLNGIINVLKPSAMTSHDVVSFLRKTLDMKKIGHTGTLDPNACGVLPICIGKSTKIIEYIQHKNKKYRAEVTLGYSTDTQDKYGRVLETSKNNVSNDEIINVVNSFKGKINQLPPMYSALKKDGKRLYELAREGKTIERNTREIFIETIDILSINKNKIMMDVICSKGTYIRTLCNDIGERLGTFAHMSFLERLSVGDFNLSDSYTLEEIVVKKSNNDMSFILPLDNALKFMGSIYLDKMFYKHISNGLNMRAKRLGISDFILNTEYKIYCNNDFIGIGIFALKNDEIVLKMDKVLV
ncbi:MAG: tRNA pseudouridine(55) synthase TruB [Senegalia sp. (in: firmicutes)]|uniref:tRNA pseudouridine(55) synthase TruB n=1 Tax=Senegalia sp. (in: firmicutes) TaxID=1924098 RepID=UPI003F969AB8